LARERGCNGEPEPLPASLDSNSKPPPNITLTIVVQVLAGDVAAEGWRTGAEGPTGFWAVNGWFIGV